MSEAKSAKGGRRPNAGAPVGRSSSHGGGRKVNRGRTPPTPPPPPDEPPSPELSIGERPIGRNTLMELQDELRAAPWPRAPLLTVGYNEVPLDRGSARAGPMPPEPLPPIGARSRHPRDTSAPEIEVSLTEVSLRALTMLDDGDDLYDEGDSNTAMADYEDASPFEPSAKSVASTAAPPEARASTNVSSAPAHPEARASTNVSSAPAPPEARASTNVSSASAPPAASPPSYPPMRPVSYPPATPASTPPAAPASSPPPKPTALPLPRLASLLVAKPAGQPPKPATLPESKSTDPAAPLAASADAGVEAEPFEALELRTFVVPLTAIAMQASVEQKLALVRARFAHRLPCPVDQVRRVDVHAFEPGSLILLVWCPVD